MIDSRDREITGLLEGSRRQLDRLLLHAASTVDRLEAQVRALSPAATLERGYAVVHGPAGGVVRSPEDVTSGDALRIRLAHGEIAASAH